MANKRGHIDLDPDYEDVTERQSKRQRVIVEDAKEATRKKIQIITAEQFDQEIYNKETEIDEADQRLHQARIMMDRLRACIVANYYGSAGQQRLSKGSANQPVAIHPTVKNVIGKRPRETTVKLEPADHNNSAVSQSQVTPLSCFLGKMNPDQSGLQNGFISKSQIKTEASSTVVHGEARSSRFKIKKRIIVGNVSKFIPMDRREENDQPTHKWMVYVRGPQDTPDISHFVQKIWFFLHPSYRPNDLVEVSQPPFHLTRRGWGEFPLRVQLHFKDQRNKRLDIIHNLKLDRTYTGLQTLGAETVVDIELERDRSNDKSFPASAGVTALQKQVAPHSSTKKRDAENNITIQEQASPNKIQSMPLLAEHLLGKIPTNENSNMSVQSDKENLYNENVTSDSSDKASGSVQFSGSLLGSKVNTLTTQVKSFSNTTINGGLSTSTSQKVSINIAPSGSKVSATNSQNSISMVKSNSLTITKSPSNPSVMSVRPSSQPTLILTSSIPGRCVTTGLSTMTTSVATATVATATTRSHGNTVVTSTLSKPTTEQTLYVRCSDNQGNVFLVPHHMLKHLPGPSSTAKPTTEQKSVSQSSTATSQQTTTVVSNVKAPSLIVATANKPSTVVTNTTTKINPTPSIQHPHQTKSAPASQTVLVGAPPPGSTSKDKIILSVGGSLLGTGLQNSALRSSASYSQGQGQLGIGTNPVLLIKTDQSGSSPNLTLITKPQGTSVKGQKSQGTSVTGQKTSATSGLIRFQLQGNVAQPTLNVRVQGQGQHVAKSQGSLKVTSQGLKSVDQRITSNSASNTIVVKNENASNKDKMKKNCQLASLLTGEISLTNRKPVQVVNTTNRSNARSLLSPDNSATLKVSTAPTSSVSTGNTTSQNTAASNISVLTSSTVVNNSVKLTNAKSLLKPATGESTNLIKPLNSNVTSQSKTVLAKIGNQTLILQLPVSDSTALTPTKDGVKGQSQQQTVTLSLKSNKVGTETKDMSISNGVKENLSTVSSASHSLKGNITQSQVKSDMVSQDSKLSQKPSEEEKSILNLKKKRNLPPPPVITTPKRIPPIRASDFPDMASLVRAAVIRHPIVCPHTDRTQHPYCANDTSQWLAWNPGKRRASEWQRASTCRRFLLKHIGEEFHKGTKLWTTKQIMMWCRLHAYSPHYMEKPLHPTGVDMTVEEAKVGVWFSTVSDPGHGTIPTIDTQGVAVKDTDSDTEIDIISEVSDPGHGTIPTVDTQGVAVKDTDSDTEIDIVSEEPPKVKVKVQIKEEIPTEPQLVLPPDDEDIFVQKSTKKIGISLEPYDAGEDIHASVSEKLIFTAMKSFARDLIQEAFSLKINQGRYPDGISVMDVYQALSSLPVADFVSNKHLGVTENNEDI